MNANGNEILPFDDALEKLLLTMEGKVVIKHLLDYSGVYKSSFFCTDMDTYSAGARAVGMLLVNSMRDKGVYARFLDACDNDTFNVL